MSAPSDSSFWKRKLDASLDDRPDKLLNIVNHKHRAQRMSGQTFPEEAACQMTDWTAAGSYRLPFPPSSKTKTDLSCFKHPLGGGFVPLNEWNLFDDNNGISQKLLGTSRTLRRSARVARRLRSRPQPRRQPEN
jgi:hypothetical protein